MLMDRFVILALCVSGTAFGQTTVSFETELWKDFGSTTQDGVVGNFFPGWTSVQATPDIGVNVFSAPNQSLSGAANDAAIWLNHYNEGGGFAHFNEIVGLSLSGFTAGEQYSLSFSASFLLHSAYGWEGNDEALEVGISGADIETWSTTLLHDDGDGDGMNEWVAQTINFTAMSSVIEFGFGEGAVAPELDGAAFRIGIDGFDIAVVPAPSGFALLGLGGLGLSRRRR